MKASDADLIFFHHLPLQGRSYAKRLYPVRFAAHVR